MVRSQIAHGIIRSIDLNPALAIDGVLGAWTGTDLREAGYGQFISKINFPNRDGSPYRQPVRYPLAIERVRYVGDPIAFVVATSAAIAKDAAEAVAVDVDPLPPVTTMEDAVRPDAPNFMMRSLATPCSTFIMATPKRQTLRSRRPPTWRGYRSSDSRVIINPMELRSCLALNDAAKDHWTLNVPTQGVFGYRAQLAGDILRVKPEQVTILTGHVGGSFGMRGSVFPEHVCALHAAAGSRSAREMD